MSRWMPRVVVAFLLVGSLTAASCSLLVDSTAISEAELVEINTFYED